jgi:hypothetical protein
MAAIALLTIEARNAACVLGQEDCLTQKFVLHVLLTTDMIEHL